jgi:hypothetical protein
MAELYLKNSTGSEIEVADLGLVIADGQSITIDENDFDGYLTADLIAELADLPANGLILSTTDIGQTSGDLPAAIAIERLTLKSHWKPSVDIVGNLPTDGNEDGDIRLVRGDGVLYQWNQGLSQWDQISSTFSLTVEEYDGSPSGANIEKLVFVSAEDAVYIDSTTAYVGPPNPPGTLNSQALVAAGTTLYSGALSQSNINYKSGDPAGDIVNYIITDGIFTLTTPDTASRCNYGDKGTISVYLNGTAIATMDLAANFSEGNRTGNQDLSTWDSAGTGDSTTDGVTVFTGTAAGKGSLEMLSVGIYNGFKYYQKWTARINITDSTLLRQGWNEIYLTHDGLSAYGGNQTSVHFDIFYDTDAGSNPSVSTPTVTENTPVWSYLSGVKYYDAGSTWDIDVIGSDCFDNVYHSSEAPIELYGWPGMTTQAIAYDNTAVTGLSDPPDIDETMTVTNLLLTQAASQFSADAQITARPRDPYGNYTPVTSVSNDILIWSYASGSTELIEHFRDEDYRLTAGAYTSIPGSISSVWDSTSSLDTYDDGNGLQVYSDELYFPTVDFSSMTPTGNPDYSLIAAETNKTYFRAFRDLSTSHASGTLRMTGITKAQLYNRDIRVWIKAPSQTGWLDLTRDYNFATFTGIDEDPCWVNRDIQSNSDFQFTLGTNYTENSGYMIIVKVQYPNSSAPRISYMALTDW